MKRRRLIQELNYFIELLLLYTELGFDLAYSWPKALEESTIEQMTNTSVERFDVFLEKLSQSESLSEYQAWWRGLSEIYRAGGNQVDFLRAFSDHLTEELQREAEDYLQKIPQRANLLLMLIVLLPTFALIFIPLLMSLSRSF